MKNDPDEIKGEKRGCGVLIFKLNCKDPIQSKNQLKLNYMKNQKNEHFLWNLNDVRNHYWNVQNNCFCLLVIFFWYRLHTRAKHIFVIESIAVICPGLPMVEDPVSDQILLCLFGGKWGVSDDFDLLLWFEIIQSEDYIHLSWA